jgi:tRNA(Arg) A34 adenosine deaminase TadA
MDDSERYLLEAIELARENIGRGGQPFGAVVVKDGRVIARGVNEIHLTNDPTAHAELVAVRAASQALGSPNLTGSTVYASGNPCPMCLAAMRMAGVESVAYAYTNDDAAPFGLSSAAIYADLARPFPEQSMHITHLPIRPEGQPHLYAEWQASRTQRDK